VLGALAALRKHDVLCVLRKLDVCGVSSKLGVLGGCEKPVRRTARITNQQPGRIIRVAADADTGDAAVERDDLAERGAIPPAKQSNLPPAPHRRVVAHRTQTEQRERVDVDGYLAAAGGEVRIPQRRSMPCPRQSRSEEHTSELQSRE